MRAQLEVSQLRSEADRRVAEKEEEFETTRKNHQRALESLQVIDYYLEQLMQRYSIFLTRYIENE